MLGVIGGTGLYELEGLRIKDELLLETPFGIPSASIVVGLMGDCEVAFLPRHGRDHSLLPSEINYRANVFALKSLGVTQVLSISAVGSLARGLSPGALVLPTQYLDFTRGKREGTFFGDGVVAHVSTAHPVCNVLVDKLVTLHNDIAKNLHTGATYACVEGPRLGTKAESILFQSFGAEVVGMTNVPEAFLAREAQICYASLCIVTDFDAWHDDVASESSVPEILSRYKQSLAGVKELLVHFINEYGAGETNEIPCLKCRKALLGAILTDSSTILPHQQSFLDTLKR